MSLNLTLTASREIIVVKTNKEDVQKSDICLTQTPTKLTLKIIDIQEEQGFIKAFDCLVPSLRKSGFDVKDLRLIVDRMIKEGWTLEFSYM